MFLPAVFSICCLFAFVLELSRLRSRTAGKVFAELCFLGAALAALTVFLTQRLLESAQSPLSTPKDALFVLVAVLTAISLGLISTHREKTFGMFLLPMILILLGIAQFCASTTPFATAPASRAWGMVHGVSMLLAAVSIFFGFLSGIMYLRQAWNLKHPGTASVRRSRFSLPSLEWLHVANRHSMKLAATALALGVLSGVVLDAMKGETVNLLANWMILGTTLLLIWFVFSLLLGFFWKRANAGPQIARRTILNFIALCTLFGLVIFSQHRLVMESPTETPAESSADVPSPTTETEVRP
ncbi:MAG: hypothetical protein IJK97_08435 [Thermoguttaceae bacterium]|nr:hypothetical protein [Thermoguttaceae bacterium]